MKRIDTILKDTRLQVIKPEPYEDFLLKGYLNLRCGKQRTFSVVMSVCFAERLGGVEHVSVKLNNDANKTPTWEEMCEVKDIFWKPNEEVHQIHPPESQYVHGVGGVNNILHLWRPEEGWPWEPKEVSYRSADVAPVHKVQDDEPETSHGIGRSDVFHWIPNLPFWAK
ncbi:DUF7694 domain-containing protein [Mitsuokella sp.]|uniref:DUF7694 domain-containing protein n=1 Tax=Mitsuokella sp. TaxID=2049034 RepID=UPI003D7D5E5B